MTVVGARRASSYGREVARELGRELAAAGDGGGQRPRLRHRRLRPPWRARRRPHRRRARLRRRRAYPAAHRSLWRRICDSGLVLSELPPGAGAWRWTFPARNRIMAALAGMTVVVEAARALRLADHGRPRRRPGPRPGRGTGPGQLAGLGRAEQPARRRRLPRARRPGRARRDAGAGSAPGRAAAARRSTPAARPCSRRSSCGEDLRRDRRRARLSGPEAAAALAARVHRLSRLRSAPIPGRC